jgi:hypothetical protein
VKLLVFNYKQKSNLTRQGFAGALCRVFFGQVFHKRAGCVMLFYVSAKLLKFPWPQTADRFFSYDHNDLTLQRLDFLLLILDK